MTKHALSVEERASIQIFLPGFYFAGSWNQNYLLGNAVQMKFAQAIAEHLLAHMARQAAVELRAA
jgi:hypothetical protein